MSSGFSAPCVRGSRLMRGLNQNCRCLLNLRGRMVDLFDLLRQPVVEHRKPRSVVVGASLLAVRVEGFKQHGDGFSQNHSSTIMMPHPPDWRSLQKESSGISLWGWNVAPPPTYPMPQ